MSDFPMTLFTLFQIYRRDLGYGFVACIIAVMRHWQLGDPVRERFTNGVICGLFAVGIDWLLELMNIHSGRAGWMIACIIGYVGVQNLLDALGDKVPLISVLLRGKRQEQKTDDSKTS